MISQRRWGQWGLWLLMGRGILLVRRRLVCIFLLLSCAVLVVMGLCIILPFFLHLFIFPHLSFPLSTPPPPPPPPKKKKTGGTPNKLCGRVGDSPLVGAGAYANSKGGVSCTGFGESIMKVLLAKTVVDYIEFGLNGGEASERGVEKLGRDVNGLGGVICIDEEGRAGYSYNTPFMARAVADGGGLVESGI